jgi:hypothetical protein
MNGMNGAARPVTGPNDLLGSLQVVSLLDFCQFLLLNGKTGTLTLFHRSGVSRLYFSRGEIVNAIDESQGREGREVALSLFRIREGGFRFRQEEVVEKRRIEGTTENLLLDAARKMDEIGEALPETGGGDISFVKGMQERQEKGEALRRLFSSIEESLNRNAELPGLLDLLRLAEEGGADSLLLETGRPPLLLRGNRVLGPLPGSVRSEDLKALAAPFETASSIDCGNGAYRMSGAPEEGRLFLRRRGRAASLAEANISSARVDALLRRPSGLLLLVAETAPARRLLYDGLLAHLGERGEIVVTLGERAEGEGKGLFIGHPAAAAHGGAELEALQRVLSSLPASRVSTAEVRGRPDAHLLLDLLRRGHLCIAALPGWDGGDALRRADAWFREEGSLRTLAAHLCGVVALQFHAAGSERLVPVASAAPVSHDARRSLEAEDYAGFSAALERSAGADGFAGCLGRLVEGRHMERSEADRIASLLSALAMEETGATPRS